MRSNPSPLRTAAAVGAALALTLAACGGDDDSSDSTTAPAATDAPADEGDDAADTGDAPVMQPSSISFDAQESDGTTITVATIDLPAKVVVAHKERRFLAKPLGERSQRDFQ